MPWKWLSEKTHTRRGGRKKKKYHSASNLYSEGGKGEQNLLKRSLVENGLVGEKKGGEGGMFRFAMAERNGGEGITPHWQREFAHLGP